MMTVLRELFSEGFIPHGHCYLWKPGLVWLHAGSDFLTAIAYYLIPVILVYFVRKRPDVPFPEILILFSAFILACGTTHLLEVWTLWHPVYWVSGSIKAATAVISLFTAWELVPLMPQALALASPAQLEAINQDLTYQITERQQTEAELRRYKDQLEVLVMERTAELLQSNQQLQQEVADRKRAEIALQQLNQEMELKVQERTQELACSAALLREREKNLRALVENTPDIIARFDCELRHLYVSPNIEAISGLPADAFLGKTNQDLGMPDALVVYWETHLAEVFATGHPQEMEFSFSGLDGVRHYQAKMVAELTSDGSIASVLATSRDITALKQTQEALQQSETLFRRLFEEAPIGIVLGRVSDRKLFRANQMFCQMFGYSADELAELSYTDLTYPDDLMLESPLAEQAIAGAISTYQLEKRYVKKSGEIFWGHLTSAIIFDREGQPLYGLGMVQDISDRKRAEAAFQQQVQQAKLLRVITHRVRQSLDLDEILKTAVTEVRQTFQADRALIFQLLPNGTGQIIKESVLPQFLALGEGLWTDACLHPESLHYYCVGKPRIVSDVALDPWGACLGKFLHQIGVRSKISAPIIQHLEDGSTHIWGLLIVHACVHYRQWQPEEAGFLQQIGNQLAIAIQQSSLYHRVQSELAERKQIEEQLRTSLQEKEVLLKEVHHRVKNNLQMVSSLLSLQADSIHDPDILKPFIDSQQRVKTMALIHEKLYQSNNLAKINFAEYIQDLVDEVFQSYTAKTSAISHNVEVENVELAVDVAISCGLIVNELVSNAIKYAFQNQKSGEIKISFASQKMTQYILTVTDNGAGMPEDVDFRHSASLGLQIVCALTRQLRGTIKLDCTAGSAFSLEF